MLSVLPEEENYFSQSLESSASDKARAGYGVLGGNSVRCIVTSLLDGVLEQIKVPWLVVVRREGEAALGFVFFVCFFS